METATAAEIEKWDMTYLSFGAGVQSTTLAIMSALGLRGVPRADIAVFADTQAEPKYVYQQCDRVEAFLKPHGIKLIKATLGSLWEDTLRGSRGEVTRRTSAHTMIPAFTRGKDGREAMLIRKCTSEYKIEVVQKAVRQHLGLKKGERAAGRLRARALIGISLDEAVRMRTNKVTWMVNHYPLIDAGMTRNDCIKLLEEHGFPIPMKSACVFCPYHDDTYWRWLKANHPEEWDRAVLFDTQIRNLTKSGVRMPAFLHRSLKPLGEVDLNASNEPDQKRLFSGDGFKAECEGMCGV